MKVLVEAFHNDATNIYLPHNYLRDFVVYPGTHDMQTVRGWWQNLGAHARQYAQQYMAVSGQDIVWDLIRLAFASVADMAIIQMQDLLDLDNSARMNTPGVTMGNWTWRYRPDQLTMTIAQRLGSLTRLYGRDRPAPAPAEESTASAQAEAPPAETPAKPDR
jgi:4-alpha-glucanotransferase